MTPKDRKYRDLSDHRSSIPVPVLCDLKTETDYSEMIGFSDIADVFPQAIVIVVDGDVTIGRRFAVTFRQWLSAIS